LIGPMSMMAEILSGLASMPRCDTTKHRSSHHHLPLYHTQAQPEALKHPLRHAQA
jgi:hypothetical protein